MLNILGSTKQLCGGVSRRDLLRIGSLGMAGLNLVDLPALQQASAAPGTNLSTFGKAKNVILIHLYGSPSQLETFDVKPDAPVEIRGELGFIPSCLPGYQVGELLPQTSKILDRCTVIRSMTHPYPLHGVAFALTGVPVIDVAMELSPRDQRHWPYFASVVDYLDAQKEQAAGDVSKKPLSVPRNMFLPWRFSTRRVGEVPRAGPYAAFLGSEYDPIFAEYVGKGTKKGPDKVLRDEVYAENDPYVGCDDESHFIVPSATSLLPEISLDRLNRRRSLLNQIDQRREDLHSSSSGRQMDRYRDMTYQLLHSDDLRTALDTRKEPAQTRELYGNSLFGHACLTARRLVEAGSRIVSVFWDEYGLAGSGWDTHWGHYPRMRDELCPSFDVGFAGLIRDLEQRGLMDETLVVCTSEHGRTPKINNAKWGGRDHWSRAYSTVIAGAGVTRGNVIGMTDAIAGDVVSRPVSPKDLQATMYHLLGINHHMIIYDTLKRPLPLVEGHVINEAMA